MWTPSRAWLDDPALLVVYALAVHRLTRLVVADELTAGLRERILLRVQGRPMLAYLVTCPWCISIWIAAAWVLLATLVPPVAWFAGAVLAFSTVAGLLAGKE